MENFKKLLIAIVLLTFASASFAQTFGLKAGFNLSNLDSKSNHGNDGNYDSLTYDLNLNPGFHVGATAEFQVAKSFSLETGLFLTTKGYISNFTFNDYYGVKTSSKVNSKFYYIDVPVNVKKTFNLGNKKLYGALGPYLGFAIGYSYTDETTQNGQTSKHSSGYIRGPGFNSRIDYGLNIGAGVAIEAFQFGVTYSLGLSNSMYNPGTAGAAKNRVIGITIGYTILNKKKIKNEKE
jgi:hypothetical protein